MSWNRDFSSPEAQKNKRSLSSRMSTTSLSIQLEAPPLPTPNNDRMQKSTHPQSCHLANTTSLPQSQDRPRAPVSEHQTPLRAAKVSEIDRTDQQFASATTTPQRRSVRTSVSDTAWNISSDVTKPTIGVENPNTALCSEALYARLKSLPDPARKTSGGDQTPADQESPSKVPLRHPRPGTSCSVPSSSDRVSEPARFNPLPPRSSSTSPFEQIWRNGTKSDSNRSGLLEKYTSISSHDANDRAAQTKPLVKSHVHKQFVPLEAKLSPSRPQIQNALDREDDNVWDDDFDIGAKPLGVTLKQVESESTLAELDDLSGNSRESRVSFIEPASGRSREFRKDDDEEEDPFSDLADDSSFDSLDALENHRHQKLASTVMTLVGNLKSSERASLVVKSCDQLITILTENPGMKKKLITYHWVLPIVETLEDCIEPDVALKILQLINVSVENSIQVQENLCLLGTIPVIMGYADPMYQAMIRYEAARFVRDVCRTSSITLQMFISCRGLPVLVKMMQTDYDGGDSNKHIVQMAIDSVLSVFELQGATPKNNFCQIFAKHKLLQRISVIFRKLVESENDDRAFLLANKIAQIFVIFSQSDVPVVDVMAEGVCVDTILENLHRAPKGISVLLLKCIKNLSMHPQAATKLVELQCVEHLVGILQSKRLGQHQEVQNQTLNALFNLCRLSPPRLRRAAQAGLLPFLTPFVASKNPLRQFALPILCEVALHASSACSDLLFSSGCVESYLNLLVDAYWQKSSLEAILAWLTVDRERVETALSVASGQLLNPFFEAKPAAFESMVDTYHKILVASRLVCKSVSANILFGSKCLERLGREKESPIVMVSLLKILLAVLEYPSFSVAIRLRTSADAPSDAVNVKLYGLANKLSQEGGAILVREMAKRVKQKLLREYMNSP
ncbi:armadillo-type protein [Cladochytrium replicatum]|nr:armadillo-type protein [Cladochytrium replicatum]